MNETKELWAFENSPKERGTCPECKEKKKYRYYELISTGERLPEKYGKCERENNCGHKEVPTLKKLKEDGFNIESSIDVVSQKQKPKIIYPTQSHLSGLSDLSSVFHSYCENKIGITKAHLKKWNVGTGSNGIVQFGYFNKVGKELNLKSIEFETRNDGNDCGRKKENGKQFSLKGGKEEKYSMCLYGEHLLSDKTICLVESEKTAIIASFFYPQFDWLATGGANGLTTEKLGVLFTKKILYLGDADKVGKNNSTIKKLSEYKQTFKQIDLFPDKGEGYDLADGIRDWKLNGAKQPELKSFDEYHEPNDNAEQTEVKNETSTLEDYGFFERNNEYYIKKQFGAAAAKDIRISNFKMKLKYRINDDSDNIPMLFELTKNDNTKLTLEITSRDLLNDKAFSASILRGGFNYNSNSYIFKNILESLHNESKEAVYISTLGQSLTQDFYAFYNGILTSTGEYIKCDEHGVVNYNDKHFYIPSGKKGNEENAKYQDDKKFKYVPGTLTLEEFSKEIYSIYGIEGLTGLCYTIATIHRDIIFKEIRFFPFMFLYGGKGSGKSTYINFFMSFFGDPQPETTENSTDKSVERKFSQTNNNTQYIKEFSPTFEDSIKNILKNAYDGVGYSRAQSSNDNKTKTLSVQSGLFIDGNYFPTKDSALFSRLIWLIWQPIITETTKTQIQKLQDLLSAGNGLLFSEIYKKRDFYKSNFSRIYREKITEIKTLCKSRKILFSEREISHIAIMAVVFQNSIKSNEKGYSSFIDCLVTGTQKQSEINESMEDVNKFFEDFGTMVGNGKITDRFHYKREAALNSDYLFIDFNACYDLYAKNLRETGAQVISKEGLKQKLMFNISKEYHAENNKQPFFSARFGDKTARCFVFNIDKDGFELSK